MILLIKNFNLKLKDWSSEKTIQNILIIFSQMHFLKYFQTNFFHSNSIFFIKLTKIHHLPCTLRKFHNFAITQILREITFRGSEFYLLWLIRVNQRQSQSHNNWFQVKSNICWQTQCGNFRNFLSNQ